MKAHRTFSARNSPPPSHTLTYVPCLSVNPFVYGHVDHQFILPTLLLALSVETNAQTRERLTVFLVTRLFPPSVEATTITPFPPKQNLVPDENDSPPILPDCRLHSCSNTPFFPIPRTNPPLAKKIASGPRRKRRSASKRLTPDDPPGLAPRGRLPDVFRGGRKRCRCSRAAPHGETPLFHRTWYSRKAPRAAGLGRGRFCAGGAGCLRQG